MMCAQFATIALPGSIWIDWPGLREMFNYYNYYTNKNWGAASSYDLCINISKLGYDKSFEFILDFVKKYLKIED